MYTEPVVLPKFSQVETTKSPLGMKSRPLTMGLKPEGRRLVMVNPGWTPVWAPAESEIIKTAAEAA
jgi:hypothetical protein